MYENIENINTRDYCLTCWVKDITQETFKLWLFSNYEDKINKYTIGNTEETLNELPHFHVYLKFKNPIRMTTLINRLNIPSTHFEKMRTNLLKCHNYCIIEKGCFDSNISNELLEESIEEKDSYDTLVFDIFENNFTLFEICRKYGKICILHFDNVSKLVQLRDKEIINSKITKILDDDLIL